MTMKTKRGLAVGGGTVLCVALAILIAARFAPEPEATAPDTSDTSSTTSISVEISTAKHEETKPIEIEKLTENKPSEPDNGAPDITPTESDPEKEAADFIDGGGIEINQDFSEPEKTESAPQNKPPAPPQIEDEEMLSKLQSAITAGLEQLRKPSQTVNELKITARRLYDIADHALRLATEETLVQRAEPKETSEEVPSDESFQMSMSV